jgi:hypothetical protein
MHPPHFTLAHIVSLAMICVVPLARGCAAEVRKQDLALVAARLEAAGMAH